MHSLVESDLAVSQAYFENLTQKAEAMLKAFSSV
jgi:hypothetical protein